MTCPICDQKPMNCDCTATEKRQWAEIEDLRLTDEEREAIELCAAASSDPSGFRPALHQGYQIAATLRGLLERTASQNI